MRLRRRDATALLGRVPSSLPRVRRSQHRLHLTVCWILEIYEALCYQNLNLRLKKFLLVSKIGWLNGNRIEASSVVKTFMEGNESWFASTTLLTDINACSDASAASPISNAEEKCIKFLKCVQVSSQFIFDAMLRKLAQVVLFTQPMHQSFDIPRTSNLSKHATPNLGWTQTKFVRGMRGEVDGQVEPHPGDPLPRRRGGDGEGGPLISLNHGIIAHIQIWHKQFSGIDGCCSCKYLMSASATY